MVGTHKQALSVLLTILIFVLGGSLAVATELGQSPVSSSDLNPVTADGDLAPVISAEVTEYRFGSLLEGVPVVHDFVVKNTGNAELVIDKVRASCGCTTVSFTKHIPPGEEGKIRIKVDTRGYGGHPLKKGVSVYSNDPVTPRITLGVAGQVDLFARVSPKQVRLMGPAGTRIKSSVTIEPLAEHPFSIVSSKAANGENISFDLSEQNGSAGKRYVLTVENIKKDRGRYFDMVTLKTDNTAQPEIQVKVYGIILAKKKG